MTSDRTTIRILGFTAAAFTAIAGLIELGVGSNSWTGDKNEPTTLGILTLVMAAIMAASGLVARRNPTVGSGLAAAAGMAIPGLIALTTAGRLAIPGAVVAVAAAGFAVADARSKGSIRLAMSLAWPTALIAVLAVIYLAFGVAAGAIGILGIVGAAATIAALVVKRRSGIQAAALLVVGVVPFAVAVWWSVVIPLTALLILAIELPQMLAKGRPAPTIAQP